jgi:hypothetical protein
MIFLDNIDYLIKYVSRTFFYEKSRSTAFLIFCTLLLILKLNEIAFRLLNLNKKIKLRESESRNLLKSRVIFLREEQTQIKNCHINEHFI